MAKIPIFKKLIEKLSKKRENEIIESEQSEENEPECEEIDQKEALPEKWNFIQLIVAKTWYSKLPFLQNFSQSQLLAILFIPIKNYKGTFSSWLTRIWQYFASIYIILFWNIYLSSGPILNSKGFYFQLYLIELCFNCCQEYFLISNLILCSSGWFR